MLPAFAITPCAVSEFFGGRHLKLDVMRICEFTVGAFADLGNHCARIAEEAVNRFDIP